ncbi:MAG: glycine/betaine ABC transporter permease [Nocardioides sp.]|nr:glycine/betaine ABC transporter permease [Nocardioides sp.]
MSDTQTLERDDAPAAGVPEPDDAPKRVRRSPGEVINSLSLVIAPVLIAGLGVLVFVYYRSLDLENAPTQQRSALDWSDRLQPQITQHLTIAFWSSLLTIVIAIPIGVMLTRPGLRKIAPGVLAVANSGQALPAYGLLVIGITVGGQGQRTAIVALAIYALLPVLRNTMVGLEGVDRNLLEAGKGMGMTRLQVLGRIELPLAVPVIIAGVRTAVVLTIGMAALAALIGGGGLGITIFSGIKLNQTPVLLIGAAIVILIALVFDYAGALAERFLKPRGL